MKKKMFRVDYVDYNDNQQMYFVEAMDKEDAENHFDSVHSDTEYKFIEGVVRVYERGDEWVG